MRTNVTIELTDEERSVFADYLDSKVSKRMVSRNEIKKSVDAFVKGCLDSGKFPDDQTVGVTKASVRKGKNGEPVVDTAFMEQQIQARGYNEHEAKSYRRGFMGVSNGKI